MQNKICNLQGMMDWGRVMDRIVPRKPHLQCTLENTLPENARQAGQLARRLWRERAQHKEEP